MPFFFFGSVRLCFAQPLLKLRSVPYDRSVILASLCSSDSSDSRLPIIRRGEGSTEETYDESYADEREFREDEHSLSSDMY